MTISGCSRRQIQILIKQFQLQFANSALNSERMPGQSIRPPVRQFMYLFSDFSLPFHCYPLCSTAAAVLSQEFSLSFQVATQKALSRTQLDGLTKHNTPIHQLMCTGGVSWMKLLLSNLMRVWGLTQQLYKYGTSSIASEKKIKRQWNN